ncbi:MAG TPA: ATP synthase F1 subunit gamma [Candidatus Binataceae bacterium]|nr:ATP synthase F1 subunit gamma [Candidatus Binataceae bacterium]
MATLKAIRRRIASVKSTQQITRAMKLVAAARLRRAQEALLNARPYHEALTRVADSLLASAPEAAAPAENAAPVTLVIVVSSDRGLCGGYNANLIRAAESEAQRLRAAQSEPRFFAVGRKALDHFRRYHYPLDGERINNVPRLATVGLARDLATIIGERWRTGAISAVGVVYSQFRSPISQRPVFEKLLPIAPSARPADGAPVTDYLIEPSAAELVPRILRSYLEAAMLHALLEAEASEYGAKMTAMDAATNNAAEMISRLTLEMNRARQAQITKELMDIVGGAEALRGAAA